MSAGLTQRSSGRGRRPLRPESKEGGKVIRVEECGREDLPEVEAILQLSPGAAAWPAGSLADTLEHHPVHFLVGRQGKDIAGFITGRRVRDEGEILNLGVKPWFRRQGVGKALVQALLEVFAPEGVVQVFLEVRESNAAAIKFYRGLGFRQIGKRERYYRDPVEAALVLRLKISSQVSTG